MFNDDETILDFKIDTLKTISPWIFGDCQVVVDKGLHLAHCCALYNNVEALEFFVNNGLDLNVLTAEERTPLIITSIVGSTEVEDFLIKKEVNVNTIGKKGKAVYINAASEGNYEVVKLLIKNKCDIDITCWGVGAIYHAMSGFKVSLINHFF